MPFTDIIGHERPKAILKAAILHDRIAHAYLFHGEEAIGKRLTALRFAQALACDSPQETGGPDPCGTCRSCQQIQAHTHPDFHEIDPDRELANPQIKIEQIRELEHQIIYRPLLAARKVCLIDDADRMTLGAANALLKTLEEPPDHSLLLLITSRPMALPATIRSRCQALRFSLPSLAQVEGALKRTRQLQPGEARFLALLTEARIGQALKTDVAEAQAHHQEFGRLGSLASLRSVAALLTAAEAHHKADRSAEALDWLGRWVRDLILVRVGMPPDLLVNATRQAELEQISREADFDALLALLEDIEAMQRGSVRNLNLQMLLESVLLRLRGACLPNSESLTSA